MLNFIAIMITLYVCVETFLLATAPDSASDKTCFMLKCILSSCACFMLVHEGVTVGGLLALIAIALFMWGSTFYRLLAWLEEHEPLAYALIQHKLKLVDRRQK